MELISINNIYLTEMYLILTDPLEQLLYIICVF